MPTYYAAPTFRRDGVVAGFVLDNGAGLTPAITRGVLFAQGTMYRPVSAPALPAASASTRQHLHFNSSTGFYWSASRTPTTAGDAYLGWVLTDAAQVRAWSVRRIGSGEEASIPVAPVASSELPPEPLHGTESTPPFGQLVVTAIAFVSLDNTDLIQSGQLTLWYVDELLSAAGELASGIDDDDTALTTVDPLTLEDGTYVEIGSEIIRLEAGDGSAIARGALESNAAAHAGGARIWEIKPQLVGLRFPFNFFGTLAQYGSPTVVVPFRCRRLVASQLFVTNDAGDSPIATSCYTNNTDRGNRRFSGGQVDLAVDGVVGIGSNLAIPVSVPQSGSVRDMWAEIDAAPVGADLECVVKVDGSTFADVHDSGWRHGEQRV